MNDLTPALLDLLAAEPVASGLARLAQMDLPSLATAHALASEALAAAEARPASARRWLDLAAALDTSADAGVQARVAYARARLHLVAGDLAEAETFLRQAQAHWLAAGDRAGLARSYLGLLQILTITGRYTQAEDAARLLLAEVTGPAAAQTDPDGTLRLFATINLGNLLRYQDRHAAALAAYDEALAYLAEAAPGPQNGDDLAHVQINRATCLLLLDRPAQAEAALGAALAHLETGDDGLNLGRAHTNLGSLYLNTGRYAAALTRFDQAAALLLGDPGADLPPDALRQADMLLLDRANAYLALNLLPEALAALDQCADLFRSSATSGPGLPYELGQTRYLRGLVHLRRGDWAGAGQDLAEAGTIFRQLGNGHWQLRSGLALAELDQRQGDWPAAARRLASLPDPDAPDNTDATLFLRSRMRLLRAEVGLGAGDLAEVRAQLDALQADLDHAAPPPLFPQLRMAAAHAWGKLARADGDLIQARRHFGEAVALLEDQRVSLPLEEVRSAFLDDKSALYRDLVLSLLDAPDPTPAQVAQAFAVVEQARARTLLERLLAAVDEAAVGPGDASAASRREQVRQELTWIYNQILGEGGSRRLTPARTRQMQGLEDRLRQLEWGMSPLLAQAQPVDLAALRAALAPDQQAIVYFVAEADPAQTDPAQTSGEILAFVVGAGAVRLVRGLSTPAQLAEAQADLRFQLGRAEMGGDYLARHGARVQAALSQALHRLYHLLIAPLAPLIQGPRLLIVPHGPLHLLPFHALWDGEEYLLARYEIAYAPSASVAVHCAGRPGLGASARWAGLAITDPSIPQAPAEVARVAAHFPHSRLFLDGDAGREGLRQAAQADVLHLATHGLFRPDNPFFSALKLADGWLDVREIYRLPLAARLVVLSACESGASQVRGGDEVVGLARGFLGAGAASLVVSLWNVHDAGAVGLMDNFYRHLTGGPDGTGMRPAAALAAAQRQAAASGQHPYFWAAFVAIG